MSEAFKPGDWVMESWNDGPSGRYGVVRDPAYSPTGRVRVEAKGAYIPEYGGWIQHNDLSVNRHYNPEQTRHMTAQEISIAKGEMRHG